MPADRPHSYTHPLPLPLPLLAQDVYPVAGANKRVMIGGRAPTVCPAGCLTGGWVGGRAGGAAGAVSLRCLAQLCPDGPYACQPRQFVSKYAALAMQRLLGRRCHGMLTRKHGLGIDNVESMKVGEGGLTAAAHVWQNSARSCLVGVGAAKV